ncbi:hypothetical protein [Spirulina subsalsa]|uniref:hypothetical protein n=1 Tax=Spirulina subsalsa TaxID=54311 RepID=UPI0002DEE74A|nr:hypothetical protein [Spirulina subsalsa]
MKFKLGFLSQRSLTPLDRAAWGVIGLFTVLLGVILVVGSRNSPRVVEFSWENRILGLEDEAFTLTFNRPMDWETVRKNLTITPELPGKMSHQGRRFAYTLTDLPLYGTEYKIELNGALERPLDPNRTAQELRSFTAQVRTRDLAFAYLGVEGNERGRLVLYNVTQARKFILTPPDLIVTNFRPHPSGKFITFSAYDRATDQGVAAQQVYKVTTGLNYQEGGNVSAYGRLTRILDAADYQNLNFDLATQGETMVIERINRRNPSDQGLWVVPDGENPRPLGMQGSSFRVSPDGRMVAIAQRQGVNLISVTPDGEAWRFFPDYIRVLGFSQESSPRLLLVRDNRDLTQSLVALGPNQTEQEILSTRGQILDCAFEPRQQELLYCIRTEPLDSNQTQEQIFLTLIDLETSTDIPLVALANDPNAKISISPDGRNLLFDQVSSEREPQEQNRRNQDRAIASGNLWLLTLPDLIENPDSAELIPPERLTPGLDPQWLR